ncbi:MAG: alpha/beta fold hydrolase [Bacteroidales bacterium]|nr:alpha/beta fold hydrolase [Bacteroidales bacterium]MCF8343235.1 alpha/beta fold hydrolase [Bacteroidales bacterium]MCF8350862.1 alpha/beta fold hydrolase [Bacteroidales bacterium]MCF8374856.1 alpha/beta fold hydrolase [Bacteroidales bacterium]MCF8399740.1 alpha/beta fold hydrolase [Bacteroidales bacterium]
MRLYHRHYGEGQPLIILHGLFGLSDNWVTFAKKIAHKGFEVSVPDQRNHGRSPHSDTFNYLAMTDDLMEFIEEHNIEYPVIMGHSMGGKVAMRFALENPGITKKLIVVDIAMRQYGNRHFHKKIIQSMRAVDFEKASKISDVDDQLKPNIPQKRIRQFIMKNLHYRDNRGMMDWRINFEGICDNMDELFDKVEVNNTYEKPALIIRGGDSDYVTDEDIDQIKEHFTRAEIHTIGGASHWVHAEKPEAFNSLVLDFLKS